MKSRDGYVRVMIIFVGHVMAAIRENFSSIRDVGEISDAYGEVNLRFRVCIHLFEDKQLVMVCGEGIRGKYLERADIERMYLHMFIFILTAYALKVFIFIT